MANTWWVLIPKQDQGKPADFLESVDFRLQFPAGSAEDKALRARRAVNWAGQTLVYWKGPFATEAAAKKGQAPKPSPNPIAHPPGISDITGFLSELSNGNLWVRVGEVLLGLILITVGVAKMTNAVPIATKIASKL